MNETPSLQTAGDLIQLLIPQAFAGRLSAVVSHVRQQLPGLQVDWTAVREAYLYGRGRLFPIASRRPEAALKERAKIRFSRDGLEAYLILFPPKPRGERLTENEVSTLAEAYGIPFGLLDPQAVRLALMRRSHREAERIANGRPAVDGKPASVRWAAGLPSDPTGFLAWLQQGAPYPETILAEVEPGQVVGARTPPEPGTPGLSVTGRPTQAQPGTDAIRFGRGLCLSPDGRSVVAVEKGHLHQYENPKPGAEIRPILRVQDAQQLREWSDGIFPGSLIVDTDLELPFPLRVFGDMEVRGAIIRSSIEVMGSLFVRDGIIQQRLSPLRVGGLVSAGFFERADVIAHTIHIRRYSLKSRLTALDRIVADAESTVKGGQLGCLGSMVVGALGASNGIATEIVVAHSSLLEPFQETFHEWAETLRQPDPEGAPPTRELLEAADFWQANGRGLEQPDPLECMVRCDEINPGVTVRFGPASRSMQNTVGPMEMRYERIGPRGRVSMTRL